MSALEEEIKTMIIDVLGLEGVTPADIGVDEGLFEEDGLALDSIDALEIGVTIQKTYGIKLNAEDESVKEHFRSVGTLAAFIASERS